MLAAADDLRPLYRVIKILGAAAIAILALGLVEFLAFEPLGQHSGLSARVEGVFRYDPAAHQTSGADSSRFSATEDFAAVIDWSSLPSSTVAGASWSNSLGTVVGGVGPKSAGQMTEADRTVPVKVPSGLTRNIPGQYLFVVERFRSGQPVEVLARRLVLVRRGT